MADLDLAELERLLLVAAKLGPWQLGEGDAYCAVYEGEDRVCVADAYHDAALIVAAVNALPKLIERVRELEASRDVWRTRAESAAKLISDIEERADRFEAALRDMTDRYHDASGEADRLRDRIDHARAYMTPGDRSAYDRGRADERADVASRLDQLAQRWRDEAADLAGDDGYGGIVSCASDLDDEVTAIQAGEHL